MPMIANGRWQCDTPGCQSIVPTGHGDMCHRCIREQPPTPPQLPPNGICSHCGKVIEDDTLCDECAENTYICVNCHNRYDNDLRVESEDGDLYCLYCHNELFFRCCNCDDEFNMEALCRSNCGDYYCGDCYHDRYITCDDCGNEMNRDDASYDDNADGWYCRRCSRDSCSLHEYHCGWNIVFNPRLRMDANPIPLYLGVELETDKYGDRGTAADELEKLSADGSLFHMEEDGSLEYGIEIISQPCTLEFHKDSFPWDAISAKVQEYDGLSHGTSTCGLHIHFNKMFFEDMVNINSLKLMYLFERFWEQFVIFSRRRGDSWMHYAAKYDDDFAHCETEDQVAHKIYESRDKGRYFAVNITHTKTIEIRIFKGTLRVPTILASIELVDFLARYVKCNSIQQLQQTTWDSLVASIGTEYVNLNAYLVNKHLKGV